jgi:hypothetical protein
MNFETYIAMGQQSTIQLLFAIIGIFVIKNFGCTQAKRIVKIPLILLLVMGVIGEVGLSAFSLTMIIPMNFNALNAATAVFISTFSKMSAFTIPSLISVMAYMQFKKVQRD